MANVKITVTLNGPYQVDGPIKLVDEDGNEFPVDEGESVWLCRCGGSSDKPFCDGTHRRKGFDAPTKAT